MFCERVLVFVQWCVYLDANVYVCVREEARICVGLEPLSCSCVGLDARCCEGVGVCVCLRGFSCARDCVRPLLRVYVRAPRPIPQRPSPIIERKFFRLVDG